MCLKTFIKRWSQPWSFVSLYARHSCIKFPHTPKPLQLRVGLSWVSPETRSSSKQNPSNAVSTFPSSPGEKRNKSQQLFFLSAQLVLALVLCLNVWNSFFRPSFYCFLLSLIRPFCSLYSILNLYVHLQPVSFRRFIAAGHVSSVLEGI